MRKSKLSINFYDAIKIKRNQGHDVHTNTVTSVEPRKQRNAENTMGLRLFEKF